MLVAMVRMDVVVGENVGLEGRCRLKVVHPPKLGLGYHSGLKGGCPVDCHI